jgi:hypothetical protein
VGNLIEILCAGLGMVSRSKDGWVARHQTAGLFEKDAHPEMQAVWRKRNNYIKIRKF